MLNKFIDKQEVFRLYGIYNSQTKVANIMGVTHQRVHQIVKNYHNSGTIPRRKNLYKLAWKDLCFICNKKTKVLHHGDFDNTNDTIENLVPLCDYCHNQVHKNHRKEICGNRCISCNRIFEKEIMSYSLKDKLCVTCINIKNGKISGKNLFYPNNCVICGIKFSKINKAQTKGRCRKCYEKTDPERIRKRKMYQKKYDMKPERILRRKEIAHEYYINNIKKSQDVS